MAKKWLGERKTAVLQGHEPDFYLDEKRPPPYKWVGERKMAVRRKQWEKDRALEQAGLLNYQNRGMSANPQSQQQGAGGNVLSNSQPFPKPAQGFDQRSEQPIQYKTADNGLVIKRKPTFATMEQARAGQANWTDVATDERKKLLSNPEFYKNNEITKYPFYIQQQILADPALDWKQLPKWQQKFHSISSNPKIMALPLAWAGGVAGSTLGPVGMVAGAYVGYTAGVQGVKDYDPTKGVGDQPTISAKLIRILNVLSEYQEMATGYTGQLSDAVIASMKGNEQAAQGAKDILFDPATRQAALEAGRVTYEYADLGGRYLDNLFQLLSGETKFAQPGQDFVLGAANPVDKARVIGHNPITGKEVMVSDVMGVLQDARHEIRAEINAGRDPDEVVLKILYDANIFVGSQIQDLVYQSVLDPLNILPGLGVGAGKKIAEVSGNKVAAKALSQAGGLNEAARRYKTSVQTGQALIIDPKFQVDKMGLFSRMVAGVNKAGEVKAGSLIPSETGLLSPVKDKTGFLRSMVEQTPHARAETGANMFYENISALLTSFEDPHEAGKYLKALANSDMETWAELGSRFAESPEFYTVLPALKEFNISKLEGIVQQWDLAQPNRDAMLRMADMLGEQPAKWLEDTANGTFEQDFQRLKEKVRNNNNAEAQALRGDIEAGRITAETLKQIVDLFTGEGALSWHAGQWKALMLDALGTHFDEWVTKRLMLDKSAEATSAFYRTTALMKQAQSILLLGGSPGYAITNGLSNMVHRAVTGIYGYMTPNQINTFLERMGVTPARMEEGVGIGGQVEQMAGKTQVKTEAMTKAVRGKGALTTAKNTLSKISRGMPMSKLSSWFEKTEGRQGFAIAMKQFWSQSWRRGVGFRTMSPEMVNVIKEMGIAPERIYAAIEAGMNQGEIEKALFGRYEGVQARALIHDAAQKTGLSASQAAEMLEKTGALDTLDNYLKGQTTKDGVQAAFTRAERVAQDYIDMQTGEDLKASAEAVKQRVGLEGAASALDMAQKATSAYTDVWMDHYARFGEVMTDLKLLDDPAMRSKAIDYNYQLSDVEFRRLNARHATNYTGIFEAWGLSGNEHALNVLAAIGESDVAMRDAYRGMRDLRRGFFDTYRNDWDNPGKWDKWDADNKTIERLFKQGFADKHAAEVKMGKSLAAIYGSAAGEAALKWWEDVTAFNDEIVKREQDFRKRLEGLTKDQRDIAKQKYYSETKIMLIAEADKINGEGIARLERVFRGPRTGDGGPVSPVPTPPTPLAPDQSPAGSASAAPRKNVDELNALLAAAEQRKGAEAKVAAERLAGIWDVAEEYWGRGAKYSRGILQDKFALLNAIRKVEYGGIPDLKGLNDTRLTPELVRSVMEARKVIKATQATEAAVTAFNQPEPVKKRNLDPNNMNLLQAIAGHGGLNMAKAKDLIGEKRPRTMQGVFTKKAFNKGWDITDMARHLANDGFEIDLNHPDDLGGAKQATDLLNRAIIGDKIYPMGHDYSKALAAAEKAYIETFEFDAIPEVPFDQTLWQREFADTIERADLTKMYELIGDFPEELSNTLTPEGETFVNFMSRIADETAARVEAGARDAQVKENLRDAQAVISEAETRADAVTTKHLLKEKFQEAFGLDEAQAGAWMELSEAAAGWYAKRTGESADAFYARYYGDVVKADGGQGVDGGLEQANANRIWYSKLTQTVEAINQSRMTAEQLRGALTKAGVKADEIKWMGLDDFMQGKKNITKAEALDFLRENQVRVEEVTKGYDVGKYPDYTEDPPSNATKFSQHTLPGGENYREVLFTLPVVPDELRIRLKELETQQSAAGDKAIYQGATPEDKVLWQRLTDERDAVRKQISSIETSAFKSQHWNEPNVLAHVRLNDRVDAQGKRVLFVEEVQSDWHQAGREKGYDTTFKKAEKLVQDFLDNRPGSDKTIKASQIYEKNLKAWGASQDVIEAYKITQDTQYFRGVPDAPFSKTWHELVMKRVLRMAAEEGYDRVGWTTGEQQAARYDLSKQVDAIKYTKFKDGRIEIDAIKDDNSLMKQTVKVPEELTGIIGKDAAQKIADATYPINREGNIIGSLRGKDLAVGGQGMKAFYDQMLPGFMDKYGKKWGAKTGETRIFKNKQGDIKPMQYANSDRWGIAMDESSRANWGSYASPEEAITGWKVAFGDTKSGDAIHSVDVTPAMRESVMQGQPLFQTAKGAVTFDAEGIKATIHAFEARDFTTLVHENGHVFRRMLADVAERTGNETVKADLATIEKWAGVKNGKWERAHEEKFARGFEEYITEGKAPTPALARAFESFKRWMLEIYKTITGSVIDVKVTDDVRGVFDRMLGGEGSNQLSVTSDFVGGTRYSLGDIVRMRDGTQTTVLEVQPDASMVLENGRVVSPFEVTRVAAQENMFGDMGMKAGPDEVQTTLFQEADQPFGAYDAASGYHPQGEVLDQGWSQHVRPLLEAMQEGAVRQLDDGPRTMDGIRDMSPEGQAMLRKYMKQVQGEMASTKLATVRWGENQRDFALLNYNKRYGVDRLAEALYPYQFYYTRSLMTWAARTLDKPALYSNYARLRMQQDRYERDIPERLRGKIKISARWLPEWMGGNLYIDPLTQLFFPANVLRPIERAQQDKNYQMIEAERILQEWTADGTYSESQAAQAAETQSGTVWERALAEAQIRRESEIASPFDFFSTMFGPAWYLSTPLSLAGIKVFPNQGEPGKVNTTPLYNTIRGLDTVTQGTWAEPIGNLIGMLGKPEEWLRKKLELPEFGELTNYYVDKQLSNMVAEGLLTSEQATIVMIERQGEFFEQARERVKMEMSLRVPTMGALYAGLNSDDFFKGLGNFMKTMPPSLFGAGLLPAGELEYRGLKQEWDEMWKRADAGDTKAKQEFFDKYPEYEAYLAKNKWDEPEERLKSFLIGQIWDGYYALGETNRKQFVAEAGTLFDQSFLDKETRSFETLDVETLTQWARMLNKKTPAPSPALPQMSTFGEGGKPQINYYDPSVTMVTDEYFSQRTKKFPNFYEEQTGYWALPKSERNVYLLKTPGLKAYWDWQDIWYKKYPQYVPIFSSKVFQQVDTSGWPPGLVDYVISYAYTGKKLPSGAMKALEQQWIVEGMPMDDLKSWIDSVVVPAMLYGQ